MTEIGSKLAAAREYLSAHPDEARYVDSVATAKLEGGLRFRVEGPDGEAVTTDMPTSVGGSASAPSPGWLFRAALSSCVGTLVAMRAAEEGVRLTSLEVAVESESDDRGILAIDSAVPSGPLSVLIQVRAVTGGPQVDRLIEEAARRCPVHDAIARAVPVRLEIG
ncbi:MAG: OsmC family protein [Actinobacteria bacterium]|nr:OsmC family protein [Actinomycetota bacterium]